MAALVDAILRAVEEERSARTQWETTWQEVADFVLPSRASFTSQPAPGSDRRRRIFDTTAEEACEQLAAGLHGMLTSRSQRWFYIVPENKALRDNHAVKVWLEGAMRVMYSVLNAPESQFHSQIDEIELDAAGLGTGILYSQEDSKTTLTFQARFLGECLIRTNKAGFVDTLYRVYSCPVRDIVEEWGEEALDKLDTNGSAKRAYLEGKPVPDQMMIHAVMPRHDRDYRRVDAKNLPFASVYLLEKQKAILSESGYHEFPYHVIRWRVRTGEKYGVGPGIRMLPEIRMLNEMFKTVIKAAQKVVDPPMQMPDRGFLGPARTMAGGLNYYRAGAAATDRMEPIRTEGRIDIGVELLEMQRQVVRRGFFADAFDITADSDGTNVKATFTLQRRDDKFRKLAPVFGRHDAELLEPIIQRVFNTCWRQGLFDDQPEVLAGQKLIVDYVSPVARAMRTAEAEDMQRLFELTAPLGQVDPDVWLNIDTDRAVRIAGEELFNVPASILRSKAAVETMRREANEKRAAEQQIVAGQTAAAALKDAAKANRDLTETI